MNQAIELAKEHLPTYKASLKQVQATKELYKASLSPYFPSLDASTSQERVFTSLKDFNFQTYDLSLSYTLFDGGQRRANRKIAELNLDIDREESRKTLLDLEFDVKSAFYIAIARKDIVEQREIQLKDARRDYEVAKGRNRLGVSKLSDVLQASVRYEQARFDLIQGQGELKNALSDLNSLIGRPLQTDYDLVGSLTFVEKLPKLEALSDFALRRPEMKQAENSVRISQYNKDLETSAFFPILSASASYSKIDSDGIFSGLSDEDKTVGITATWNIFQLDKFFKRSSAALDISVSQRKLDEVKRRLLLELAKRYQDFITAAQNVRVSRQQLKEAEHNYAQAFGEYKVGKGDILSLVVAEGLLSNAREQLIESQLSHILAKVLLERVAGIERLEEVQSDL